MVITLTLNPCTDKTLEVDGFVYGGTNKVISARSDVSGKGINVSIVLKQLGWETICLGFQYDEDVSLKESLTEHGIPYDLIPIPGAMRVNVKIFDTQKKIMTEFNESGSIGGTGHAEDVMRLMARHVDRAEIVVVNGSAPVGMPNDIYQQIITYAKEKGKKTILDASGPLLLNGIKAAPYLVKPNKVELEEAFQTHIESLEDAVVLSRRVLDCGVKFVCVSMGKEGAVLVSKDAVYFSSSAEVEIKGVQGAGDSMVAGICIALLQKRQPSEILRYGVAAAHGSLLHEGTQLCRSEDLEKMLCRITAERILS